MSSTPAGKPNSELSKERRRRPLIGTCATVCAAMLAALAAPAALAVPASAAAGGQRTTTAGPVPAVLVARDLGTSRTEARRRLAAQDAKDALADRLTSVLGARSAGTYIDSATGRLVVNVTDQQAAELVRDAGARARVVARSMSRLERIQNSLERVAVPGTTTAVDVRTNTVEVTVPKGRSGDRARKLIEHARSFGEAVTLTRTAGAPRAHALDGGEALRGGGFDCAAAFAAERGGAEYVLTAGHCTDAASAWYFEGDYLGPSVDSSFPGSDYGLIRNESATTLSGQVLRRGEPYEIVDADNPPVGSSVCTTVPRGGTDCGTITAYDLTIHYPKGSVHGLIGTNVCTHPGDSGAPLYTSGNTAVGILSGGRTTECSDPSFRSYFENVTEALSAYDLTLK